MTTITDIHGPGLKVPIQNVRGLNKPNPPLTLFSGVRRRNKIKLKVKNNWTRNFFGKKIGM